MAQHSLSIDEGPSEGSSGGVKVSRVEAPDERFDRLWARWCDRCPILRKRDRAYLTWRFHSIPGMAYTTLAAESSRGIEGYAVFKIDTFKGFRTGVLVDLFPADAEPEVVDALLAGMESRLREFEVEMAMAYLCGRHARHLRRHRYIKLPQRLKGSRWFVGAPSSIEPRRPFIADMDNWYLTYGDTDFF